MKYFSTNHSLFYKYLLSYVIILIIPIVFMVYFVYNQFIGVLKDELIANNVNTLNRVMYVVDTNLKQLQSLQSQMLMNRSLNPFYALKDPNVALDAVSELKKYTTSNTFIKEAAIYFHGDQYIYTSSSSFTVPFFINNAYKYKNWSEQDFTKDINSVKSPVIRPAEDVALYNGSETTRYITFLCPLSGTGINPTTTAIFMIDENFFTKIMSNSLNEFNANSVILDQNNQIITSLKSTEYIPSINYYKYVNTQETQATEIIEIDNQQFLLSIVKSKETGWKYLSFTPLQAIMKKSVSIQLKFLITLVTLLLIGSVVVYYNMQTNYKPIRQLKMYTDKIWGENTRPGNEIDAVRGAIDYLSTQNSKLIESTQNASKEFILLNLLKGRIRTLEEFNKLGHDFGIKLKKPLYCVFLTLFHTTETTNILSNPELSTSFESTVRQFFDGYVREHLEQNKLVIIVSLDSDELASFKEKIALFHEHLKNIWNTPVTIGIGNTCSNLGDIPVSYIEASSAIDYRLIKGTDSIIFSSELAPQEDFIDAYPHKELDTLKYLIKQGNANEIEHVLSNILSYIRTCDIPLFIARGLCFDLVNITSKAVTEVNRELLLTKSAYPNASLLAEFETIDDLTEAVKNICFNICAYIRESKISQDESLIASLVLYIKDHYMSCDFSIQSMADHFDMTLTNISQYFKNQTGQTIIDYTSNLRMEKAKELLVLSELTLNDIAFRVGYLNASSFIRRFKQLTGLTPGQYIKENRK